MTIRRPRNLPSSPSVRISNSHYHHVLPSPCHAHSAGHHHQHSGHSLESARSPVVMGRSIYTSSFLYADARSFHIASPSSNPNTFRKRSQTLSSCSPVRPGDSRQLAAAAAAAAAVRGLRYLEDRSPSVTAVHDGAAAAAAASSPGGFSSVWLDER